MFLCKLSKFTAVFFVIYRNKIKIFLQIIEVCVMLTLVM